MNIILWLKLSAEVVMVYLYLSMLWSLIAGVKLQLHSFLSWSFDEGGWLTSCRGCFTHINFPFPTLLHFLLWVSRVWMWCLV